ncbi:MAG: hypothetical protein FWG93_01210 [Oscillospiraceae bacterium]|nr:hypothetical protein [Oscillospiraceae bacterium]
MKRLIALLLTAALLTAILAGCALIPRNAAEVKQTPVRYAEKTVYGQGLMYFFDEAVAEADVVADVTVLSWLDEVLDNPPPRSYFLVQVNTVFKGNTPDTFVLAQAGNSEMTFDRDPLHQVGDRLLMFLNDPVTEEEWGGGPEAWERMVYKDSYSSFAMNSSYMELYPIGDTLYAADRNGFLTKKIIQRRAFSKSGAYTQLDDEIRRALRGQMDEVDPFASSGHRTRFFWYDEVVREIELLTNEEGET